MKSIESGRRDFLKLSGALGGAVGGAWLAAQWPAIAAAGEAAVAARASGSGLKHLDPLDGADLEAIADQIIPTDDTPGARSAGVIHFIDESLGTFMAGARGGLDSGLGSLNAAVTEGGHSGRFADLDFGTQRELLVQIEQTSFFGTMRYLTVAGMFAMPKYGGNRDQAGWALIGFNPHHGWEPPFGHYDAPAGNTPGRAGEAEGE